MYHAHTGVVYRVAEQLLPSFNEPSFPPDCIVSGVRQARVNCTRGGRGFFLFQSCLGVYYGKSGILHKLMYTLVLVDFFLIVAFTNSTSLLSVRFYA